MLNYGGSITSAFPNTLCSSPNSITCQLCNKNLKSEPSLNRSNSNTSFVFNQSSKRLDKCIHCGINICENCLNENHEKNQFNHFKSKEVINDNFSKNINCFQVKPHTPESQIHYSNVKKDFKNMYNFSKEIVEKLHFLNNSIKVEELAVSELNLIKHQVNTKAIELIKQVNQEKLELIEQIENAKRKHESTLNERKEYYALSMQYKDELRKVIRKYKDSKIEENSSLNDLLKMYFSVKTISKNLDDYDHIKLITEEEPLRVDFEERPVYRNIIGKLLINNQNTTSFISSELPNNFISPNENKNDFLNSNSSLSYENKINTLTQYRNTEKSTCPGKLKPSHRSVSLNDLLDTGTDLNLKKKDQIFSTNFRLSPNTKKNHQAIDMRKNFQKVDEDSSKNISKSINNLLAINERATLATETHKALEPQPFFLPDPQRFEKTTSPLSYKEPIELTKPILSPSNNNNNNNKLVKKSILKNSDSNNVNRHLNSAMSVNDSLFKRIDIYKLKVTPRERLEVDILPSHLNFSNNKLLIASTSGKIRVIDLITYKIQKDEIKNLLINSICRPKNSESNTFYAVTNGEMKSRDDELNVSDSIIIVTRSELKVLKNNSVSENDNYLFSNPSGICYDHQENIYVSDTGFNRIKVMDKNFQLINTIKDVTGPDDKLSRPGSITNFKNLLYVCDNGNRRIVCYLIINNGRDFKFRSAFGASFKYPLDLSVDNIGVLSVRDHYNNRLQLFSPDLNPFHYIEISATKETVYDIAVSDSGNIYVSKMCNYPELDQNGNQLNKYFIDIY